jgi:acyl-coenzyme A thioesterase PaaI-like protein
MQHERAVAPAPLTLEEFQELATQGVPFVGLLGCRVERFAPGDVVVRLPWADHLVRPAGRSAGRR